MKSKVIVKLISAICCLVLIVGMFATPKTSGVSAATSLSQLKQQQKEKQAELNKLKEQKASQEKIKAALDADIAATQALINECNRQINEYNSQIAAKQREIDAKNKELEEDKEAFRKRIRAIYMSGNQSYAQILLGAESFSEYLILEEMTSSLAARDAELIERINAIIAEIEKEQAEIETLMSSISDVKAELDAQKAILDSKVAEVNSVIKGLNKDIAADQAALKKISDQIDSYNTPSSGSGSNINFSGGSFLWPVASSNYISAYFNGNDSVHKGNHKGIDIAGSGISGKPIRAAADGYVYYANNSCSHNYRKNYSCGCGGGYGNYVAIDHGKLNGTSYKTLYAHMVKTAVSSGTYVKRGQTIGYVGTTGWSTGPHLHFEVIVNGVKRNPLQYSYER